MSRIMKRLNYRRWASGNIDSWWYNISSPSKLSSQGSIQLSLWDEKKKELIKRVVLNLEEDWLSRITKASTHFYQGREICKVHINRKHDTNQYIIYFGRKEDGTYLLP